SLDSKDSICTVNYYFILIILGDPTVSRASSASIYIGGINFDTLCSIEALKKDIKSRIISKITTLPSSRIKKHALTPEEAEKKNASKSKPTS
ncbi:MAG: hypothetical protein KC713_10810, partial [Candidatus Omnitrophica bacterium]|nr:hypothetical protein [Candidatus Omnitrophota bacterium]